mgnify:CR=1 FL=1
MTSIDELRAERLRKLELLKEKGIDPYPADSKRTHTIGGVLSSFEELEKKGAEVTVNGRVMSVRTHGALTFVDLFDGTRSTSSFDSAQDKSGQVAKMQVLLKEDEVGEEMYSLLADALDIYW